MFVFDTEKGPDASATDFRKRDEKAEQSAMLEFTTEDSIEYPIKAEDRVDENCEIVYPWTFVAKDVSQEGVVSVRVEEGPIHGDVPDGAVDGVHAATEDEQGLPVEGGIDTVER